MNGRLMELAGRTRGFMPAEEGLALHQLGLEASPSHPMLEVGGYCGLSALYLGSAAQETGSVLFSVDHHRGSEENQAGWEHHDPELVDARTGRMDSLPFFRRTIELGGLEAHVFAVVGASVEVAAAWATPLSLLFIDGGHGEEPAMADYEGWSPRLVPGAFLAIHDVFPDPVDGGQAPFHVFTRARADGFVEGGAAGSLRWLRAPS
ncbi:MAG: 1-O-methyltransferase [Chloroflexota bacterium]|jgi:predicted O-methyltransferase YrrM|nr:1-O-methyltransferase [Chloroflexota bacterium]